MWKIQIFIFVEAILLTLAAITILSVDFSRFMVLMVLFLLLLYYYFDCGHFICGYLWFIDRLPLYV